MQNKHGTKRSRTTQRFAAAIGTLAGAAFGVAGSATHANAAVINVALANNGVTQTSADAVIAPNNHGITPFTYGATPANYAIGSPVQLTTIADFPTKTYDAADTNDTGNTWNSLQAVTTNLTSNTSGVTYLLEEMNVPLVDSTGASTGITLNQYLRLPNNKGTADAVRLYQNSTTAGTDGLLPNPANSLDSANNPGDGYGAGASHLELMGTGWSLNGTTEGLGFTLSGLQASTTYSLYLYSASTTLGQGGNFTAVSPILTNANGITTGGTVTGTAVQTNTSNLTNFRSVFDASGNPLPEKGLSWNLLSVTSDASGNASFALTGASAGLIKPILNGFQFDTSVPEPASMFLLGLGSIGMCLRRRPRS